MAEPELSLLEFREPVGLGVLAASMGALRRHHAVVETSHDEALASRGLGQRRDVPVSGDALRYRLWEPAFLGRCMAVREAPGRRLDDRACRKPDSQYRLPRGKLASGNSR